VLQDTAVGGPIELDGKRPNVIWALRAQPIRPRRGLGGEFGTKLGRRGLLREGGSRDMNAGDAIRFVILI
jgi:hypothetical protein